MMHTAAKMKDEKQKKKQKAKAREKKKEGKRDSVRGLHRRPPIYFLFFFPSFLLSSLLCFGLRCSGLSRRPFSMVRGPSIHIPIPGRLQREGKYGGRK